MDEFSQTLSQLQSKVIKCSKSDRLLAIDFLKNIITNLEHVDNDIPDESAHTILEDINPSNELKESKEDLRSLTPLKLTIRKYKKNEFPFICYECNKEYMVLSKFITHVLNTHSKSEVTCRSCKGTFHSYSLLKVHECFSSRQTLFIRRLCGICGKLCRQIRDYQLHMKIEHKVELDQSMFGCNYCEYTFRLRSQLLAHISKRHKEVVNKEQIAQRIRFKLLKKTISTPNYESTNKKNEWRSTKYSCLICKRNFLSQRALERHSLSYMHRFRTGELKQAKKFDCDVCKSSFIKLNCLQRHMSSHQTDLPHTCTLCDYRTSEKCNLAEHLRRHYQIRNYVCEFCESKFIAKRELKDHIAFKHNSTRPYECLDCGKKFKTKRILTRHTKIHSDFRPYVCACGSNFLRMTNLRRHLVGVHHDANPSITKVPVSSDKSDIDNEKTNFVWYADSKYIKVKKITTLTLEATDHHEKVFKKKAVNVKKMTDYDIGNICNGSNDDNNNCDKIKKTRGRKRKKQKVDLNTNPIVVSSNNDNTPITTTPILPINFIIKVSDDDDKDSKLYSNISQDFLYQSDTNDKYLQQSQQSPSNIPGVLHHSLGHGHHLSQKSSLQDSNTIDDSMNICDLVTSLSYPLIEPPDQSEDVQIPDKLSYDISIKNEPLNKYKVESIMMESDNRNNLDGIWRPIDTVDDDDHVIIDEHSSSLVSNSIDMFPPNSGGLISSFNEVFMSSVSNNCYSDDSVQWNGLSLSNGNAFSADNSSSFIITGTMSACGPLSEQMPVSDSVHTSGADNFLFYNTQHPQQPDHQHPHQSFAYIESYSSAINLDHNYGSISDSVSFCASVTNSSFQATHGHPPHLQDLFPMSYSSAAHSDFCVNSVAPGTGNSNSHSSTTHNGSLSNMLFSTSEQQQSFFQTNTNGPSSHNWLHQSQHSPSPGNEFSSDSGLPPSLLESYKLSAQLKTVSSNSNAIRGGLPPGPPRILSPIDFLVTDSVFPGSGGGVGSGVDGRLKHEFCLALHEMPSSGDLQVEIGDNPLISDFCSQPLHQYQHSSGQLCSKNFSVVNLISTGCVSQHSAKDTDDIELLYS